PPAVAVRCHDLAILKEPPQVCGALTLATMRAHGMDPRVEGRRASLEDLERHRANQVGMPRKLARVDDSQRSDSGHRLSTVDEREALLRADPHRADPGASKRDRPTRSTSAQDHLSLAEESESEMSEQNEIPARADGALRKNHQ